MAFIQRDSFAQGEAEHQPDAETARVIPQADWNIRYSEIEELYIQQKIPLAELKKLMDERYKLKASNAQWKKKIKKWNLRRNLSPEDAAHILRLMNEAIRRGLKRQVRFNKEVVDPKRISNYIKKSKKFADEKELLTAITPTSTLPQHITYADLQSPPLPARPIPPCHGIPNIVFANATECGGQTMLDIPSAAATPSRSRLTTPRSSLSRHSSFSSFELTQGELPGLSLDSSAFVSLEELADEENAASLQESLDEGESDDLTRRCVEFGNSPWLGAASRGMLTGGYGEAHANASGFGYLSSTPVAMLHQPPASTVGPSRAQPKSSMAEKVIHAADEAHECSSGCDCQAIKFLNECFYVCICVGQAEEDEADGPAFTRIIETAVDKAMQIFAGMIINRDGMTLNAVSMLLAMLEVHGQLNQAQQLLTRALKVSNEKLGKEHALSSTISWMLAVTGRRSHLAHQFDSERLEKVKVGIERYFGVDSNSALTATYNFAWAVLHEKRDFKRAEAILLRLRYDCERVFGLCNVQTIITSVTLARAYFYQGQVEQAELLIKEMIGRLNLKFERFHPYRLEALSRQAKFLEKLGKQDEAEELLKEVVFERFSILGPNNSMSTSSLEKLHRLRKSKGHDEDLKDLYRRVSAQCHKTGPDKKAKKRQAYQL